MQSYINHWHIIVMNNTPKAPLSHLWLFKAYSISIEKLMVHLSEKEFNKLLLSEGKGKKYEHYGNYFQITGIPWIRAFAKLYCIYSKI